MEFYSTLDETISALTLTPEQQERLYPQLKIQVQFKPEWLRWNDGTVKRIAEAIESEKRYDDLPILGDALEDAGADQRTAGFFRMRNRWALWALLETNGA